MEAHLKAFAYLRVSGLGQVDRDGFIRQRETIDRYVEAHDIEIVDEFRDEAVPGKTELADRPGLAALLARLETNGVKLVIVEISDRLARDIVVNELIIREFQKVGVRVISASGGVDLTAGDEQNPTAKLIRQILAAVAEFDRCIIVQKTLAARERLRAKNGKCEGRKNFGFRPGEEAVLATIRNLAAEGRGSEFIADYLNENCIKTRYGKRWNSGTVWKIINRPKVDAKSTP
jgi:DNA invertase Pin-like site-specific DNA recombinase